MQDPHENLGFPSEFDESESRVGRVDNICKISTLWPISWWIARSIFLFESKYHCFLRGDNAHSDDAFGGGFLNATAPSGGACFTP